jgi:hypothetical protein
VLLALAASLVTLPASQSGELPKFSYELDMAIYGKAFNASKLKVVPETDPEKRWQMELAIKGAMKCYPKEVLEKTVERIFIVRSFEFDKLSYGGTYTIKPPTMVIVAGDEPRAMDWPWTQRAFHHEFSSMLVNQYSGNFFWATWIEPNADGFKYISTGFEGLRKGVSNNVDFSLCEKGILTSYGAYSVEEDLNTFAEHYMTNYIPAFFTAVAKYPRIRRKVEILKEFYASIDKRIKPQEYKE